MALTEDLMVFFGDFGVPCSKGTTNFTGLWDVPDNVFDVGGMAIQSTEYNLIFRSSDVSFKTGDAVTVSGLSYVARSSQNKLDDGMFSAVKLNKV
jgi:hypothetical protein